MLASMAAVMAPLAMAVALPVEVTGPVRLAFVVTWPAVRLAAVPVRFVATPLIGVPRAGLILRKVEASIASVTAPALRISKPAPTPNVVVLKPSAVSVPGPWSKGRRPLTRVVVATPRFPGVLSAQAEDTNRRAPISAASKRCIGPSHSYSR